jgi:hypothetical protein
VQTSTAGSTYTYRWSDPDYQQQQTRILKWTGSKDYGRESH